MRNNKTGFGASTPLSDHLSQQYINQKKEQQDELNYFSGLAFDQFGFEQKELDEITSRINKKVKVKNEITNLVFISLLSGLLIGVSMFFIIFNKSKNHVLAYQNLENENAALKKALNHNVLASDTVFNISQNKNEELKEHFTIQDALVTEIKVLDELENLEPKTVTIPFSEIELTEQFLNAYIPNAPVLFISNLKVANYKTYYFKQNQGIDLALNTGLSAQYENETQISALQGLQQPKSTSKYFAHLIIQRAMKLFSQKQFDACTEELNQLYSYNKQDANAQFYLGMCYFEKQQYQKAIDLFETNLQNEINIFHQEAEYYKAICLLKTKKTEQAKQLFEKIKANQGFYASRVGDWL